MNAKKLRKDLDKLKSAGYDVPDALDTLVNITLWTEDGVRSVWECATCDKREVLYTNISSIQCAGHPPMKLVWKSAVTAPSYGPALDT